MQQRALLLMIYLRKNTDCSCYFFRKRMEVWTGDRNGNHSNGSKIIRKESVYSQKEWTSNAMKKIVKRACAGMFAALMAVSAMSVPSSAACASGVVGLGTTAGGCCSIDADGAYAYTYASSSITLNVNLSYSYINVSKNQVIHKGSSNANNPVSRIDTWYTKPSGHYRSYSCSSSHNASFSLGGKSYHWSGSTGIEYY